MSEDIQELLDADPFRPFVIATTDGDEYTVYGPKQIAIPLHGETLHFASREGNTVILAVRHIVRVVIRGGRP